MTLATNFVDISSAADIIFRGQSDIDLWNQHINLKSFELLGKEQTFAGLIYEETNCDQAFLNEDLNPSNTLNTQADLPTELCLDGPLDGPLDDSLIPSDAVAQSTDTIPTDASTQPQPQPSDNQLQSTPPIQQSQSPSAKQSSAILTADQQQESETNPHSHLNEDLDIDISINSEITEQQTIEDDFVNNIELIPEHTLDLDNGNNILNVITNIGNNSSSNAQFRSLL